MEADVKTKLRRPIPKRFLIIGIAIVVVIAGILIFKSKAVQNKIFGTKAVAQRTTKVEKGDIDVTVTGSGPLTYTQSSTATTKVAGTVTKLYFKEGDKVKAGDLIAEIDNKDAVQSLQDKQNSLAQTQVFNGINQQTAADLLVKAPITGQVSNIVATVGANINKSSAVLTITDTSKLKLLIAFNGSDASKIKIGQTAIVYLNALMQSAQGKVVYINNQTDTTNSGGQLVKVEIDMDNPGALLGGMTASADIETSQGNISSAAAGSLDYINKQIVITNATGTVDTIAVKDGQKVNSGDVVVKLKNDDINKNNELADLKLQNSQSQLELAQKQLEDYKIYASIDGAIISQTLNAGDNVKENETIAVITDTNQIEFKVPIDELDIAKISEGQKVNVSIDALTETSTKPLAAVVDKVPFSGTSTNGVATFDVTVKLTDVSDKLKSGMNANADIQISNVQNALRVPVEAVTKLKGKSYVWVKSDGKNKGNSSVPPGTQGSGNGQSKSSGSSSGSTKTSSTKASAAVSAAKAYYANAVMKEIEIGANNDTYVEVKSGLNEGDTIILPQLQASTTTSTSQSGGMGGGFGGGIGGPAGGGSTRTSSSSGGGRN